MRFITFSVQDIRSERREVIAITTSVGEKIRRGLLFLAKFEGEIRKIFDEPFRGELRIVTKFFQSNGPDNIRGE